MNRIEMKIATAVTNQLSAATDNDAKWDLIEELSENLYQRYLDLAASGIAEQEAYQRAMDSLGDVDELLAYLKEEEAAAGEKEQAEKEQTEKENTEDQGSSQEQADGGSQKKRGWDGEFEEKVNNAVNTAFSMAKNAMNYVGDVAKDVTDQVRRKYPDGVFNQFNTEKGVKMECSVIAAEQVHALDIQLGNGDVLVRCSDGPDTPLEILGDTEEIEIFLKNNGTLTIRQGNTASSSFFFMRGMRCSDLELKLPRKLLEKIVISTTNGDIQLFDPLECKDICLSTVNGDLNVRGLHADILKLHSTTGDIGGHELSGGYLQANNKCGDINIDGHMDSAEITSVSGDARFDGTARELSCNSTSGDSILNLKSLPLHGRASATSGDCTITVPGNLGFRVSYHTISGMFCSDLPFVGTLGAKNGSVVYGDPICGELQLSSISGDIRINTAEN